MNSSNKNSDDLSQHTPQYTSQEALDEPSEAGAGVEGTGAPWGRAGRTDVRQRPVFDFEQRQNTRQPSWEGAAQSPAPESRPRQRSGHAAADAGAQVEESDIYDWMRQVEEREETAAWRVPSSRPDAPFRLVTWRGRLCFGIELGGRPFVDMEFKKHAPELFQHLVELFSQRYRKDAPERVAPHVVREGELALDAGGKLALARQLGRVLWRGTRHQERISFEAEPLVLPEGDAPVTFSMLEIFMASKKAPELSEAQQLVLDFHAQAQQYADEAWLIEQANTAHPQIFTLAAPESRALADAERVVSLLSTTRGELQVLLGEPGYATFLGDAEGLWVIVERDGVAAVQHHSMYRMGMLLGLLTTFGGGA